MTEARTPLLYYLRLAFKNGQLNILAYRGNVACQAARDKLEKARLEVLLEDGSRKGVKSSLVELADDCGNTMQVDVRELQNVMTNDSVAIAALSNLMQMETWRGQVELERMFDGDPIKSDFMLAQERAMRRARLMQGTVQAPPQ